MSTNPPDDTRLTQTTDPVAAPQSPNGHGAASADPLQPTAGAESTVSTESAISSPHASTETAAPSSIAVMDGQAAQTATVGETQLAAPPPPPPPDLPPTEDGFTPSPDEEEEEGMTMLEHLEELRTRIIICSVALIAGLAVSAIPVPGYSSLTWNVIAVINAPAHDILQALKPGEIFLTYLKVAMIVGAALAMPMLIYQVMAFVMPALHPHEKKYLYMAIPGVTLSFVLGVIFGYFLLLPFAINFLATFGVAESGVDVKWAFGEYIGTVATLLFWMGLAFETPLIMFFLTKLRVLNVERMQGFRKYALILAFVVGAIITPTPDPLNQTIVSVPLYLLFELGILFSKLA